MHLFRTCSENARLVQNIPDSPVSLLDSPTGFLPADSNGLDLDLDLDLTWNMVTPSTSGVSSTHSADQLSEKSPSPALEPTELGEGSNLDFAFQLLHEPDALNGVSTTAASNWLPPQ